MQYLSTFMQAPVLNPLYAYFWVLSTQAQTQLLLLCHWLPSLLYLFRPVSSYPKTPAPLLCRLRSALKTPGLAQSLPFPGATCPSSASHQHCPACRAARPSLPSLAAGSHPCPRTSSSLWQRASFSEPVQSHLSTLVNHWKATPRRSLSGRHFDCVTTLQAPLPCPPQSSASSGCVGFHTPQSFFFFHNAQKHCCFSHSSFTGLPYDSPLNSSFKLLLYHAAKKPYWGLQGAQQEPDMNLLLSCKKILLHYLSVLPRLSACLPLSLVSVGYIQSPRTSFLWQRLYRFSVDTYLPAEKPDPGKCWASSRRCCLAKGLCCFLLLLFLGSLMILFLSFALFSFKFDFIYSHG